MVRKIACVVVVGALVTFAACVCLSLEPWVTAEQVRAQIENEIPVGTPKERVSDWLLAKGYTDHAFGDGCCGTGNCGDRSNLVSGARFNNYHVTFFFPSEVSIWFKFDEQGRRTEYLEVREFTYFP